MYVYRASLFCDDCGAAIIATLDPAADTGDSDDFPQSAMESESDAPNHCARDRYCANRIDLADYGFQPGVDALQGAESRYIGALIDEELTPDGVNYTREMLEEDPANCTPYQLALHRFWRESFPAVLDAQLDAARARGREDGVAAGTWVLDGNSTEETARAILRGIEDGDPAVLDSLPAAPLSGEWADGLTPRDVLSWYGLTEDDNAADDVLRAYEDGFSDGVTEEVERSARAMLAD